MKEKAFSVLSNKTWGILATHSVYVSGFPVGSIVPYVILGGDPHFCLSDISEHTINSRNDNRVSLTVWDGDERNPQKLRRVTCIGRLENANEMSPAFLELMPQFAEFYTWKDFNVWALRTECIRYIGGFASAHWIDVKNTENSHEE
jgi:hypothetical protein